MGPSTHSKTFGKFGSTPRHGFRYVEPKGRTGRSQVKHALPIINPTNPDISVAAQASACANCKDATCSSLGCPMGKDIGGANICFSKAGDTANEAFDLLRKLDSPKAAFLADSVAVASEKGEFDFLTFEKDLFSSLEKLDIASARAFANRFKNHMYEAFEIFEEGGGRGDVYGLACPSESTTCGSSCQIEFAMARGITIAMNEKAIYEYAWANGWVTPISPPTEKKQSIAIVGSGSTGTHLALSSRKIGYQVTTFERNQHPGEMGDGKILSYKVPLSVWQRDFQRQKDSGIQFECNTTVGKDGKSIDSLSGQFDAIVLAIGTPVARDPKLGGDAAEAMLFSNEYLQQEQCTVYRKQMLGQQEAMVPEAYNADRKHVVINGHGDTAIDCARTAIAQGASSVTLISRHNKINAREKGDKSAFDQLEKEAGDKLRFQFQMDATEMVRLGKRYRVRGRNSAKDAKNSLIEIEADMVISAIGNHCGKLQESFELPDLPVTNAGTVQIQLPAKSSKTAVNGVLGGFVGRLKDGTPIFAGGEVVTGSSLLVTAGKAGIDLAKMIDEFFQDSDAFYSRVEKESGSSAVEISTVENQE